MSKVLHATYDGKVLHPEGEVNLEPNIRYLLTVEKESNGEISPETPYPLGVIKRLATDMKIENLAERHDFFAHRKLEDQEDLAR